MFERVEILLLKLSVNRGVPDLPECCNRILEVAEVYCDLLSIKYVGVSSPHPMPRAVGGAGLPALIIEVQVEIRSGPVIW